MSKYFKAFNTLKAPMTHLRNVVSSAIGKKSKKSPTIKSVKPAVGSLTKRRKDTDEVFGIRTRQGVTPNKKTGETVKKISKLNEDIDKIRSRKMGGGMMGRRFGMNKGGKIPTTPKEKKFAALAAPRDRITYSDKIAGATGRQKAAVGGMILKLGKAGKKFLKSKEGKEKLKEIDSKKGKEFTEKMLKKLKDAGFKGGGSTMSKVPSDKRKTEIKKYEKRAKDASEFIKNKGRSFGSRMREKYMR